MKIRSLLLGSAAAVGISTGAFAANLPIATVLTSLDVCDALGISGLTLSSDTNCLQITGGVSYEFSWGDYNGDYAVTQRWTDNTANVDMPDSEDDTGWHPDWESSVEAWLTFVGTADSAIGPARAVITLKAEDERVVANGNRVWVFGGGPDGGLDVDPDTNIDSDWGPLVFIDEAYVAIGDQTVLMAGLKDSIANFGDDEPFNHLGLFHSDGVDTGVGINPDYATEINDGGHVIQVVHNMGNGFAVAGGLENLDGLGDGAGTAVGVVSYAGDGITAHITAIAGGILDGIIEDNVAVHAGATVSFDDFTLRGAAAVRSDGWWNILGSARAEFDMFTLAVSAEANSGNPNLDDPEPEVGFGGSVGVAITDGVSINLGSRYYDWDVNTSNTEAFQVEAQLVAAVTETITATGALGVYGENWNYTPGEYSYIPYVDLGLDWTPGGGFEAGVGYRANFLPDDLGTSHQISFNASKEFE